MKQAARGGVACQGIGGDYKATLQANTQPKGTDDKSIAEAMSVISNAMTSCPDSKMVLAGYRLVEAEPYAGPRILYDD
jgi:cutinase